MQTAVQILINVLQNAFIWYYVNLIVKFNIHWNFTVWKYFMSLCFLTLQNFQLHLYYFWELITNREPRRSLGTKLFQKQIWKYHLKTR